MSAALPVAKLASLLVKTLSKPLSKRIKHEFSRSKFTQRILVSIGQANHQLTSRMTIWSAGYRVRNISPLEDEKALSQGAEFVGESFVLLVTGGTVVWEYNRSKEKERVAEEKQIAIATAERKALQAKLHSLNIRVEALEAAARQDVHGHDGEQKSTLTKLFGGRRKGYQPPDASDVVPIDARDDEIHSALANADEGSKLAEAVKIVDSGEK